MLQERFNILIVEARGEGVPEALADALRDSAVAAIKAEKADCSVVTVPGVFHLPGAVAQAEVGGSRPAGVRYDGYVALGALIRGQTLRYEVLAHETMRGLMDLTIGRNLLIGAGLVTADTEAQAWERVNGKLAERGAEAARACLAMVGLRRRLLGISR
ncbi:6,7-dimethyl-8-ribityllumazine synthase [Phenylobacterium montanum]|uniref:6,7-dimethyl-8-ribityllumazine synthase n=1 Tax=Phenylobacterium montanum TaxID=2823693 RepID=A0A975IVP2_9CAUL|nr:6,7-dimethyl-8-ribityllumazine synthase [Caulobacter sp. S6]QUD88980.1 6,7-dimethyl-8-ribityllumazine synthase [Caulobacter sp. S6]